MSRIPTTRVASLAAAIIVATVASTFTLPAAHGGDELPRETADPEFVWHVAKMVHKNFDRLGTLKLEARHVVRRNPSPTGKSLLINCEASSEDWHYLSADARIRRTLCLGEDGAIRDDEFDAAEI